MTRQPRRPSETGVHHVMLRGVNRDVIFLEDEDFEHFLQALQDTKTVSGSAILAYCLMTNHVHLVLHTEREPIGVVMKRLALATRVGSIASTDASGMSDRLSASPSRMMPI